MVQILSEPPGPALKGMLSKTGDIRLKPFDDIAQARGLIMKTEQRRLSGGISHLSSIISHLSRRDYDFIAVRADKGHELLRLFESTKQRRL